MLQKRCQISIRTWSSKTQTILSFLSFVKPTWFHNSCTSFSRYPNLTASGQHTCFCLFYAFAPQVWGLKLFLYNSHQLISHLLASLFFSFGSSSFSLASCAATSANSPMSWTSRNHAFLTGVSLSSPFWASFIRSCTDCPHRFPNRLAYLWFFVDCQKSRMSKQKPSS